MTCWIDGPDWTRECRDVPFRKLVQTPTDPPPRRPAHPGAEELRGWTGPLDIHEKTGIPLDVVHAAIALREKNRKGGDKEEEQGR